MAGEKDKCLEIVGRLAGIVNDNSYNWLKCSCHMNCLPQLPGWIPRYHPWKKKQNGKILSWRHDCTGDIGRLHLLCSWSVEIRISDYILGKDIHIQAFIPRFINLTHNGMQVNFYFVCPVNASLLQ